MLILDRIKYYVKERVSRSFYFNFVILRNIIAYQFGTCYNKIRGVIMKKKSLFWLFILTILVLGIVGYCIYPDYLFGSVTDWGSQHTMLPEYFRTLFYQTGDLFPDFMLHLGSGQNIYNISYYGLLNPIVLLSYLFPFIKMVDFLMIANVIVVLVSGYLCYGWLSRKGFSKSIVMVASILFVCAAPFIFHSHRHIMFVTYFPFLMLGLLGVDRYFEKNQRFLLTLSVIGMILTSYYYSIGGIMVLVIYGVYCYLKQEEHITIKRFFIDGFRFVFPILLGVGIASILLFPTAYVIMTGRSGGKEPIALSRLLLPHFDINAIVYSSYSIGLSAIAIFGLFHSFFTKKKENIFMGIVLTVILSIPMIMYALNGFLYIRAKVLIPFLPLFIYLIALLLRDLEKKKVNVKQECLIFILLAFFWYWRGYHNYWFFLDFGLCILMICAYQKWHKKWIYVVPMIGCIIGISLIANTNETYQRKEDYQNAFHPDKISLINEILKEDSNFYRMNDLTDTLLTVNKVYRDNYFSTSLYSSTFHQDYKNFFYDEAGNADTYRNRLVTSSSNNIFFDMLMNVKYIIAKKGEQPIGYHLIKENGSYGLYENDQVFPFGYVTTNLYQKEYYQKLSFPYNMELLLNGAVIEKEGKTEFSSQIRPVSFQYNKKVEGLDVKKNENGYTVHASNKVTFKLPLSEKVKSGDILILTFRIDQSQNCSKGDLSISINGISNKLTCKQWMYHNGNFNFEYVIPSIDGLEELSISMSAGTFDIVNIKSYLLDYDTLKENSSFLDPFVVDMNRTKGDLIAGTINVKQDGYFVLSIPYDKAFQVMVDGKTRNFEKVNETFLGFPLEKGQHHIEITYEAPWKKAGMTVSIISLVIFGIMIYQDIRKKQ